MFYILRSLPNLFRSRLAQYILVFLILMLDYTVSWATPKISIAAKVNVTQSQITLGSIAKIKGFSTKEQQRLSRWVLAPAPVAGSVQTFPRSYLKLKLKAAGLPTNVRLKLPKKLIVKRAVKVLKHSSLSRLIKQRIKQANLAVGEGIDHLEIPKQADLMLPAGSTLEVDVNPRMLSDRIAISLMLMEGSKRISSRRIMVKVSYRKKVVALAQNMRAGEIIQSQDLIYVTVPHREVNRSSILTTIEAIGSRLRKNVHAKIGLNTQWLISKVLVKYGDKVKITFKRNGISLSAEGQALGQGKRGDMIKVKNIRSRKILTGRIVAPNQVEMEF